MALLENRDVLENILHVLPTLSTFGNTILAGRTFYDIYQTRPKSILRSVASNEVGAAIPQAAAYARFLALVEAVGGSKNISVNSWKAVVETQDTPFISSKEAGHLSKAAPVVAEFEILYSRIYKDPLGPRDASQLSWHESLRFQRALYRYMTISAMSPITEQPVADDNHMHYWSAPAPDDSELEVPFDDEERDLEGLVSSGIFAGFTDDGGMTPQLPADGEEESQLSSDDDDDWGEYNDNFEVQGDKGDSEEVENLQTRLDDMRTAYLRQFKTQHVLELYSVALFMKQLAEWIHCAGGIWSSEEVSFLDDFLRMDIACVTGAFGIYEKYKSISSLCLDQYDEDSILRRWNLNSRLLSINAFLTRALFDVLRERNIALQNVAQNLGGHWRAILLVPPSSRRQRCSDCGRNNMYLWSPANWDLLRGMKWSAHRFGALMAFQLTQDKVVYRELHRELAAFPQSNFYEAWFEDLGRFDQLRWKVGDVLCSGCLASSIGDRLTRWLNNKLKADGKHLSKKRCRDGFMCHISDRSHQERFYHLGSPYYAVSPGGETDSESENE